MTRSRKSLTVSCSLEAKLGLEKLADRFGCKWGDKPNVSFLVEEIGLGRITLVDAIDPTIAQED